MFAAIPVTIFYEIFKNIFQEFIISALSYENLCYKNMLVLFKYICKSSFFANRRSHSHTNIIYHRWQSICTRVYIGLRVHTPILSKSPTIVGIFPKINYSEVMKFSYNVVNNGFLLCYVIQSSEYAVKLVLFYNFRAHVVSAGRP
jgi:hypothetical protein